MKEQVPNKLKSLVRGYLQHKDYKRFSEDLALLAKTTKYLITKEDAEEILGYSGTTRDADIFDKFHGNNGKRQIPEFLDKDIKSLVKPREAERSVSSLTRQFTNTHRTDTPLGPPDVGGSYAPGFKPLTHEKQITREQTPNLSAQQTTNSHFSTSRGPAPAAWPQTTAELDQSTRSSTSGFTRQFTNTHTTDTPLGPPDVGGSYAPGPKPETYEDRIRKKDQIDLSAIHSLSDPTKMMDASEVSSQAKIPERKTTPDTPSNKRSKHEGFGR